jgi:tetratricopeptide (TPR) repeat protein
MLTVLAAASVLGLCGVVGAWWYHTTRPEYRLRLGREALRRGDGDEAEHMAQLLMADGLPDQAHLLRGDALFHQGQYGRAIDELNRIRDRGDLRLEAALLTGQCLLLEHQPGQAERAFQFVLAHRPDSADAHRCLAWIYYDQGAVPRALQEAEEWGNLEPQNGRPWWMRGRIHQDHEDLDDAVTCYQDALRRELPSGVANEVRQRLAECLVKQLQWSEALEALDGRDRPLSESAEVQALRVECLWGLGRTEESRAVLGRSLAAFPDGVDLLRVGAHIRQDDGQPEAAAALLERAVAHDPHDLASRHQLALVCAGLGRQAEAERHRQAEEHSRALFAEVQRLRDEAAANPWSAPPRLRLAVVCEELGRHEWAKAWRDAAGACTPSPTP